MILTPRIQSAIHFATLVHVGQHRKGKPQVPYIIHPLTVGMILARVGADENLIAAGILHDTIEDSEGAVTPKDIEKRFGANVVNLVQHVTEKDKSLSWEERKQIALDDIYKMPQKAVLLKSADVLANLQDLLTDLEAEGEIVWERFGSPKEKQINRYQKLTKALKTVWADNPLLPEIESGTKNLLQISGDT